MRRERRRPLPGLNCPTQCSDLGAVNGAGNFLMIMRTTGGALKIMRRIAETVAVCAFAKMVIDYYRFGPQGSCQFTAIEFRRHGQPEDHIRPRVYDPKKEEYIEAEPT